MTPLELRLRNRLALHPVRITQVTGSGSPWFMVDAADYVTGRLTYWSRPADYDRFDKTRHAVLAAALDALGSDFCIEAMTHFPNGKSKLFCLKVFGR